MTIGLSLWLRKRSKDKWVRMHARSDVRRTINQQWHDYGRRGKGNRAWKRAEAVARQLDLVTVDPFAMARSILAAQ